MTSNRRRTRWFFWFGWSPERLERWLEESAMQGWHLIGADRFLNRFHFERGPSKRVRYAIDYQHTEPSDEYWTLFEDAGWQRVVEGLGYYIWRTEYEGAEPPEIFSDLDSLIQRNLRIMWILVVLLVAQIPAWISGFLLGLWQKPFGKPLLVLYVVTLAILLLSIGAVQRRNSYLRSRRP